MRALKRWLVVAGFALFSHAALAITNADLFTWAASAYPAYFPGTPTAGQYLQYDYRHYASGNYIGIDDAGGVFVLGPVSNGSIMSVGTLSGFAPAVQAWQAAQPRGKILIEAWNPDGSKASIYDFVNFTHYVINRWSMYSNYGIFPMGAPAATAQIASDIYGTDIGGVNYIAMDAPGGRPFYFTALWKAPAIGTVFMRADAGGTGYLISAGESRKLELPYDFAVGEYAQARKLLPAGALSAQAQSLLDQASAAMGSANAAASASARAMAAYTALSYIMPLKERLVLDASNQAIAASGKRSDFDMNYEGFGSWTDITAQPGYASARNAGFKSVLTTLDWNIISPTPGTYNFTSIDYQVDQARAQGFGVALGVNPSVGTLPAWMKSLPFDQLAALFREHARVVVAHFGDKVSTYYACTEQELQANGLSLAQAGELARQSLEGARAASPATPFGIYVSASAYVPYQMNRAAQPDYHSGTDLLAYLATNNIRFDFVGLEMQYGTTFAPIDLQRFQEVLLDTYKIVKVPIYLGETGYSSMTQDYGIASAFYWHDGLTQQSQYEWADGTLRILYAMPFVKGYYWVHLDPDNYDYGSDYLSGLVGTNLLRPDGTAKKVLSAFSDFSASLARIARRLPHQLPPPR